MSLNVKKGDTVIVIAGQDKGKTGKVLSASPKTNRVTVDGVNVITKHVKARSAQQQSGIEKRNGTIDVSNVMVVCPVCGKATKVANTVIDGKKVRTCKKCNAALDVKEEKTEKKTRKTKSAAKTEEAVETAEKKAPAKRSTKKKADESSEA